MQKYIDILTESRMLREYGDVGWNWFTTDKQIFATDWLEEGLSIDEIQIQIEDFEKEGIKFENYWHPLGQQPESPNVNQLLKYIEEDKDVGPIGPDDLEIIVSVGEPARYFESVVSGAYIEGNIAIWYGSNTAWF